MRNKALYGWIFTFNPYEQEWRATQNDNSSALFNGINDKVLRAKGMGGIQTLLSLVTSSEAKVVTMSKNKQGKTEIYENGILKGVQG